MIKDWATLDAAWTVEQAQLHILDTNGSVGDFVVLAPRGGSSARSKRPRSAARRRREGAAESAS
jgi:hypothetical protein